MIIDIAGITLPPDMRWTNQYTPSHAKTTRDRAISGKQILSRVVPATGKSIILEGGIDYGWVDRDTLAALVNLYEMTPPSDPPHELTIDGISRYVLFEDDGMSADPVMWYNDFISVDMFIVRLRLYTLTLDEQPT